MPFSATRQVLRNGIVCVACVLSLACATRGALTPTTSRTAAPNGARVSVDGDAPRVMALRQRVDFLLEDAMRFWLSHGHDNEFGGFHGTLNRFGEPIEPSNKGLVQQARHLWTVSAYYRLATAVEPSRKAALKQYADDLFGFIVQHYLDPADSEFYLRVDRKGNPVDRTKHLYSNSFAIYGLAEYALAFNVDEARKIALNCFLSLDKSSHDNEYGGYDQTHRPHWLGPGAAKDTNTHIHLMESFTNLYQATRDPTVRARAEELVRLVLTKHVQPSHETHAEFARDFAPVGPSTISYGHDIETSWLLFESIRALGLGDAEPLGLQAYQLGVNAARQGFDSKLGGLFEEGIPNGAPTKLDKIWWVQAEAIAGLYRLYRYRLEPRFLDQLDKTLDFVERYQRDPNLGEWYWGVLPDGSLGQHRDNKGEEWKASYHSVRALLFTRAWMDEPRVPSRDTAVRQQ